MSLSDEQTQPQVVQLLGGTSLERASGIGLCRLGLTLIAVSWVYPALLLLVIRVRTNLAWHLLHAHSSWHVAVVSMALPATQYLLQPIGIPRTMLGPVLGTGLVLLMAMMCWSSEQRARAERERYGESWLKLGQLSFWDILFFRVPRERA